MKIYIDVLMLTNAVISMVFVRCVARLTHERLRVRRELAAGAAGGAAALLAAAGSENFFEGLLITLGKAAAMLIIVAAAFHPNSLRGLLRRTALYLVCELGFGGACLALVGITGRKVLYIRNYVVYFDVTLLQLAAGCGAVYLLIVLAETVQRRREQTVEKYRAVFRLGNFEREFTAYSDTGNTLCDSFTGAPVMIFRSDELCERYSLERPDLLIKYGFHPVPYSTIAGEGLIYVTSKAKLWIIINNKPRYVECCAGIIPGKPSYAIFPPNII